MTGIAKIDYLKTLAQMAARLGKVGSPSDADLQLFRERIMARPDDLRRRLLGANVQRRRVLDAAQRQALDVLDTTPDLLGPVGELRYEPSHSRLVARFLSPTAEPLVAKSTLPAFLNLLEVAPSAFGMPTTDVTIVAERWLPSGRVDISVTSSTYVIFVEVKVDAIEGEDQLLRYSKDLAAIKGSRDGLLVYLTLPGAPKANSAVAHIHMTLDKLLVSWLPFADSGNGSPQYLARYLKTLSILVGCGGAGRFDDWTFTQQRAALDLIESLG